MRTDGIAFHHPAAFWLGCALLTTGVAAHVPMFLMAAPMHFHMAGMPMDATMLIGMAMIPLGLALAAYGLLPRLAQVHSSLESRSDELHFHLADGVPLNRQHWILVCVLVVALAVDVMKPATLGFVMPGLTAEYRISTSEAAVLALVALTGTTVGSILWGRLGDVFGRRAAILLSSLMFMGTAICGAMPSFGWNLVMCFLMGVSAGGLLPIAFTLMAEAVPARHRGWLLVALGGIGTSAGYLLASSAAALLEPRFSWRALWLLGLPTGALIVLLNRWIPESPRFLAQAGLRQAALAVLGRFAGKEATAVEIDDARHPGAPMIDEVAQPEGLRQLLRGRHAALTLAMTICGIAWGLANFGFLLWLPVNLSRLGMEHGAASALLARSAVYALPGIGVVVWLYHRWSSLRSLVLFIGLTTLSLMMFFAVVMLDMRSASLISGITAALLVSSSGVIAMLIPYAAEIYPSRLRGTGSGLIAASSKAGGMLGAGLGVLGFFEHMALSAALIALCMGIAGMLLLATGMETRGLSLEAIEQRMRAA